MTETVKAAYRRSQAPDLLRLAQQAGDFKNSEVVQGISLKDLLLKTLQVEATRQTGTALAASMERELAMKEMFLAHYRGARPATSPPKVLLAFGQNHLHRGIDHRGVSTLGNFIAELAVQSGGASFHVALFAAEGSLSLDHLQNADQRQDDPAFAFLAGVAQFPATVFDLRPLRREPPCHAVADVVAVGYRAAVLAGLLRRNRLLSRGDPGQRRPALATAPTSVSHAPDADAPAFDPKIDGFRALTREDRHCCLVPANGTGSFARWGFQEI